MYIIDDNERVRNTKGLKEKYTLDLMQVVRAIVACHGNVNVRGVHAYIEVPEEMSRTWCNFIIFHRKCYYYVTSKGVTMDGFAATS